MIFLLDIILVINLLWAYKSFKNIVAPPVLVGLGMLIASIVATSYYDGWEMYKICFETVFFLGGGTLFYTFVCQIFKTKRKNIPFSIDVSTVVSLDKKNQKLLLVTMIMLGIVAFYMSIKEFAAHYGYFLTLSELFMSIREESMIENDAFRLPLYIRFVKKANLILTYFVSYWLSVHLLSKKDGKDKLYIVLCVLFITLVVCDGFTYGNKAAILEPLFAFGVIFLFVYALYNGSKLTLNTRLLLNILFAFVIMFTSFGKISELLGRDESKSDSSLISIYIGAQIKNFDLYIRGDFKPTHGTHWGESTFRNAYVSTGLMRLSGYIDRSAFLRVGTYSLGNVYTQFYYFHKDFGGVGLFIMTFVVAMLSMLLYNHAIQFLNCPNDKNLFYLQLYSMASAPLFMTFFSSRFTEFFFNVKFIKTIIYLLILPFVFQFFKNKYSRNH